MVACSGRTVIDGPEDEEEVEEEEDADEEEGSRERRSRNGLKEWE